MRRVVRAGLVLAVVLGASACSDEPAPVVVRDGVRVLDDDTKAALAAVDPDWTLHFSTVTPLVAALVPGEVLVSDPADAAPFGLLRKVVAMAPEGAGGVAVTTSDAFLYDVFQEATIDVSGSTSPEDLLPDVPPGAPPPTDTGPIGGATAPLGLGFNVPFGTVIYDADQYWGTTADQVRLDGLVGFDAGWRYHWRIFDSSKLFDDLNPFDSFDLEFSMSIELSEELDLKFTVGALGNVDHELGGWDYWLDPITIWVGPIPVVLTPRFSVHVGVRGNVLGGQPQVLGAHQWFVAKLGASCDGDGCSAIKSLDKGLEGYAPTLLPSYPGYQNSVEGYARVSYDMLIYGIAGPYAAVEPGATLDVKVPGKPAWNLDAELTAKAGLKISPLGISWEKTLYHDSWNLLTASNSSPIASFSTPPEGAQVQLNQPIQIGASSNDLEEGYGCCVPSISSDVDGFLGTATSGFITHTFDTPGVRTLTATITDADGAPATATRTIEVVNTPPDARIQSPKSPATWYVNTPLVLRARATDANEPGGAPGCYAQRWSGAIAGLDSLPPDMCTADPQGLLGASFASEGTRTITFTATDSYEATDTDTLELNIVPKPAGLNIHPQITPISPDLELFTLTNADITFPLDFHVYDPDTDTLGYTWRVGWDCDFATTTCAGTAVITSGTVSGASAGGTLPGVTVGTVWSVYSVIPSPGCGGKYDAFLWLDVDGGTTGAGLQIPFVVQMPPC